MLKTIEITLAVACICACENSSADTFGTDPNTMFKIEFVPIGNPGNPADDDERAAPMYAGSVTYNYRIGRFEISEDMIDKANKTGGLSITKDTRGPNKPATSIDWFETAKFVNWLNTSTGNAPAYKFDDGGNFQLWDSIDAGYNPNNLFRNRLAKYFLPSHDEWYKAAYYDPNRSIYYNYPTGSDTAPMAVSSGTVTGTAVYRQSTATGPADIMQAGGLSPYGTMGQGGNVTEWSETEILFNSPSTNRGVRGGAWLDGVSRISTTNLQDYSPTFMHISIGFRVASIPEPTTCTLALAALCLALGRRRAF